MRTKPQKQVSNILKPLINLFILFVDDFWKGNIMSHLRLLWPRLTDALLSLLSKCSVKKCLCIFPQKKITEAAAQASLFIDDHVSFENRILTQGSKSLL